MDAKTKAYLLFFLIWLLIGGALYVYSYIENYIRDRKASKRAVIFKTKNGKTKGYWKTKRGEIFDKDLKLDD